MKKRFIVLIAFGLALAACAPATLPGASSVGNSSESSSPASISSADEIKVVVSGETQVVVGKTITLTAAVTGTSNTAVTWETDDASIATVVDGVVTGVSKGSATITATSAASGKVKGTLQITVVDPILNVAIFDQIADNYTATTKLGGYTSVLSVTDHGVYETLNDIGYVLVNNVYYPFSKGTTNYVYSLAGESYAKDDFNASFSLGALYKKSSFDYLASSGGIDIYLSAPASGSEEDFAYEAFMGDLNWMVSEKTIKGSYTNLKAAVLTDGTNFLGTALYATSIADSTKSGFLMTSAFSKIGSTTFDIAVYAMDENTSGGGTEEPFSSSSSNGLLNPVFSTMDVAF